ncbi:MAG: hypothetical protein MSC43_05035 [Clostridiales bacterium]|nr:hypothetical protein [Clostridiales bacterium]MDD7432227.1 hypothetical protein [Clostridiales bacterium]MDY3062201.1 hypothetical protein [Eubacteriales bacterium]
MERIRSAGVWENMPLDVLPGCILFSVESCFSGIIPKNFPLSLRTSIHEMANIIFLEIMRIGQASQGRLFCGEDTFLPVRLSFITIAYTMLRKPAAAAVKPLISL